MPQEMKMKIKFNWKRIAAAALAGVLACSMLSGCKKGGTTGKNEIMYYFYGTEAPDTAMVMEKVNEKLAVFAKSGEYASFLKKSITV